MKKWVDENKKPDGSDYDIYKDGLNTPLLIQNAIAC
jgi:hypothetical protein